MSLKQTNGAFTSNLNDDLWADFNSMDTIEKSHDNRPNHHQSKIKVKKEKRSANNGAKSQVVSTSKNEINTGTMKNEAKVTSNFATGSKRTDKHGN